MTRKERAVLVQVADALDEVYTALKNERITKIKSEFGGSLILGPRCDLLLAKCNVQDLLYADTDKRRVKI
jgi:hypothetical protein